MQTLARLIRALVLLAVAGFCVFGFMATYEYPDASKRLPWQLGYGAIGLACLIGVAALIRARK